jgi:hypothetical protein
MSVQTWEHLVLLFFVLSILLTAVSATLFVRSRAMVAGLPPTGPNGAVPTTVTAITGASPVNIAFNLPPQPVALTGPAAFACRPALDNLCRLRGVHYFQNAWLYTFWDVFRESRLDSDFALIRSHGFNTIILLQSWGKFQPTINPVSYDDLMFDRLDAIVAAAAKHAIWVVLRVGTPEHLPRDLQQSDSPLPPDPMFDERECMALADLFEKTSGRMQKHLNVYGLFNSWEDVSQYLMVIRQDEGARREYENRYGLFRAYLRANGTLEAWNAKWGTSYDSFDEIPTPAVGTTALTDYIDFVGSRINETILSRIQVSPEMKLGYEIRLEAERAVRDGQPVWYGYEKSFQLPENYSFIAAYYNPYWGVPNEGGFISPEQAFFMMRQSLALIEAHSNGLPIFYDQINLADDTPAFTRTNSKLRYPDDEARAANLILPFVLHRTLGYSVWAFRDYVGNVLRDSSFFDMTPVWERSRPFTYITDARGEQRLLFRPADVISQVFASHKSPGGDSGVAYRFDADAYVEAEGEKSTEPQRIDLLIRTLGGKEVTATLEVHSSSPARHTVLLPEIGTDQPVSIRLTAHGTNTAPIAVADVRLWNHLMATGIVDQENHPRRSRSLVYREANLLWEQYEAGAAVPALEPLLQSCTQTYHCTGVDPNGWVGKAAIIPVYVAGASERLSLTIDVPAELPIEVGDRLDIMWRDAVPDDAILSVLFQHGTLTIDVSVVPRADGSTVGDRLLVLKPDCRCRNRHGLGFRFISIGTKVTPLQLGQPLGGVYTLSISDNLAGNRLVVGGSTSGDGLFAVTLHVKGHPPVKAQVTTTSGTWQARIPMWREYAREDPQLFVEVQRVSGSGSLTVDRVTGESERTPNDIYE